MIEDFEDVFQEQLEKGALEFKNLINHYRIDVKLDGVYPRKFNEEVIKYFFFKRYNLESWEEVIVSMDEILEELNIYIKIFEEEEWYEELAFIWKYIKRLNK